MHYLTKETCVEVLEKEVVLYEDTPELVTKITKIMNNIRIKEGKQITPTLVSTANKVSEALYRGMDKIAEEICRKE